MAGMADTAGNYIVSYSQPIGPGSAVNYVDFLSAFTLNNPTISAVGSDANIGLTIQGKGTTGFVSVAGIGAMLVPHGTTGQRPSGTVGMVRVNETTGLFEFWNPLIAAWESSGSSILANLTFVTNTDETANLPNSQPLSALSTGFMKVTGGTGIITSLAIPLIASAGGSGVISPTSHGILIGQGASPFTSINLLSGQILVGSTGADPIATAISSGTGILVANGAGSITVNVSLVPVANGGTNNTSFTAYSVICAGTTATGTFQNVVGVGTSGQVLTSAGAGALPAWQTPAAGTVTSVTATLPLLSSGGATPAISMQGLTTLAQGDILYASAVATFSRLAKDTNATRYLSNTGTSNNPAWAQVALATGVSGVLPIANGGTGLSTTANSAVLVSTNAGVPIWSAPLTNGQLIIGSTGATPVAANITSSTPAFTVTNSAGAIALNQNIITTVAGRLTFTSGVPVTTTDVTGATTIYYTPYKGTDICLFSGGAGIWQYFQTAEISIAIPAAANQMYDAFVFSNSGTPTLQLVAWTNDTTRATALVYQDGVLCQSGALGKRYMGSFRTDGSNHGNDTVSSRNLWNYYNRVAKPMSIIESAVNWSTSSTFAQANSSNVNQLNMVIGVSEDLVNANVLTAGLSSNIGTLFYAGIGLDSVSAISSMATNYLAQSAATNEITGLSAHYSGYPGIGYHYLSWLNGTNGTAFFYGTAASGLQSGIQGSILC